MCSGSPGSGPHDQASCYLLATQPSGVALTHLLSFPPHTLLLLFPLPFQGSSVLFPCSLTTPSLQDSSLKSFKSLPALLHSESWRQLASLSVLLLSLVPGPWSLVFIFARSAEMLQAPHGLSKSLSPLSWRSGYFLSSTKLLSASLSFCVILASGTQRTMFLGFSNPIALAGPTPTPGQQLQRGRDARLLQQRA